MKIKIITGSFVENLQSKIDEFLNENKDIEILQTQLNGFSMHDFYQGRQMEICNTWQDYTFTIVYKQI